MRPARRAHVPGPSIHERHRRPLARTRAIFALPAMSEQEIVAFRKAQGEARDPLVVPVVVAAVLLIAGFVGWDMMRDPGHLGAARRSVRLGGAPSVLAAAGRSCGACPALSFRVQALVMYCAIYACSWRSASRSAPIRRCRCRAC